MELREKFIANREALQSTPPTAVARVIEADDEPIKKAAAALKDNLFGKRWDLGYLAVGSGKIFVYIIGKWYGETTDNWNGYPVEWQENCGPIEAHADLDGGRKG